MEDIDVEFFWKVENQIFHTCFKETWWCLCVRVAFLATLQSTCSAKHDGGMKLGVPGWMFLRKCNQGKKKKKTDF